MTQFFFSFYSDGKQPLDEAQAKRAEKLAAWKAKMAAAQPSPSTAPTSEVAAPVPTAEASTASFSVVKATHGTLDDAQRVIADAATTQIEIEKALKTVEQDNAMVPESLTLLRDIHRYLLLMHCRRGKWGSKSTRK